MQNFFRKSFFGKAALVLFSVASLSLTGCMDDDVEPVEPLPTTYVSFYHGSPDAPNMDVQLDSRAVFNSSIKFSDFSGYVPLKPAEYKVKFTPANAANAYVEATQNFKDGKAYSVFAVNTLDNMELLIVQDSVKAPATGQAALRIINLSPDAPAVNVATTGSTSTKFAEALAFKGITPFKELAGGKHTLEIKDATSDEVLQTITDQNIEAGVTYSFIIRGFKTPPAGNTNALSVQVVKNY